MSRNWKRVAHSLEELAFLTPAVMQDITGTSLADDRQILKDAAATYDGTNASKATFHHTATGLKSVGGSNKDVDDERKNNAIHWMARQKESGAVFSAKDLSFAKVLDIQYVPSGTFTIRRYAKYSSFVYTGTSQRLASKLLISAKSDEKTVVFNIRSVFHRLVGYITENRIKRLKEVPLPMIRLIDGQPSVNSLRDWFDAAGLLRSSA